MVAQCFILSFSLRITAMLCMVHDESQKCRDPYADATSVGMPFCSVLNLTELMKVSGDAKRVRAPQDLARIFVLVVRKSPEVMDHKHFL